MVKNIPSISELVNRLWFETQLAHRGALTRSLR